MSNPTVTKIDTCEVCVTNLKGPELDFGYQPLCDELHETSEKSLLLPKYHQNIVLCETCLTAHQKYQVPKNELFKPNYHYRASLTKDVVVVGAPPPPEGAEGLDPPPKILLTKLI